MPEAGPPQDARPIRSENRAILVEDQDEYAQSFIIWNRLFAFVPRAHPHSTAPPSAFARRASRPADAQHRGETRRHQFQAFCLRQVAAHRLQKCGACDGRRHKGCRPAFRRSAALADVVASPKQNGCMETYCVAGAAGLELRNVIANYAFEISHEFSAIQRNRRIRDFSRTSCGQRTHIRRGG